MSSIRWLNALVSCALLCCRLNVRIVEMPVGPVAGDEVELVGRVDLRWIATFLRRRD